LEDFMRPIIRTVTLVTIAAVAHLATSTNGVAVEPGVDIAAPRVAITTTNGSTLRFEPAVILVEQGDYVRWNWGSLGSHTTTSGSPCVANMLWSSNLNLTTTQFTRQFLEAPGTFPFFCSPHCGLGMTGQVVVTSDIQLATTDSSGSTLLSWTGGGGSYRVFRSDSPLFGAGTTVLTTGTGTSQTSFLDTGVPPALDKVVYYLVMNQF
jgi:plastocyanin